MNEAEINQTPNRVLPDGFPSKSFPSRSMGDQIASPYNTWEEELTMIPIKLTSEKPSGTESNWGSTAASGRDARDAKSGALLRRK